jgi:hypothetical protein
LVPSALYSDEAKRDSTRIRIYNNVLQHIYNKIKAISRIPGNEKSLWFVVPEFIPGTPRFDIGDAVIYIVWNLRNVGYHVEYTHPNLLFISWKAHDDFYRRVESPMSQVMNAVKGIAGSYKVPMMLPKASLSMGPTIPALKTTDSAQIPEVTKRKTPLKKTVEFKPTTETIPMTSRPKTSIPATSTGVQLPGQLSERHVSFV